MRKISILRIVKYVICAISFFIAILLVFNFVVTSNIRTDLLILGCIFLQIDYLVSYIIYSNIVKIGLKMSGIVVNCESRYKNFVLRIEPPANLAEHGLYKIVVEFCDGDEKQQEELGGTFYHPLPVGQELEIVYEPESGKVVPCDAQYQKGYFNHTCIYCILFFCMILVLIVVS